MRVAYIAPYQGPTLPERRPIVINRSLAATTKIEQIAQLLHGAGHEVEIISQGEVVHLELKFHPAFDEPERFDPSIPVHYASALPIRFLNGFWSSWRTLTHFKARHRARPFDLVLIYNLKTAQVTCANYAVRRLGLPVILEYEDDFFVNVYGQQEREFTLRNHHAAYRGVINSISGGIAVSPHLRSQLPAHVPTLLLRGVVGDDIIRAFENTGQGRKNWVLFSGTHTKSKGIEPLIQGWKLLGLEDWELHITGYGEMTDRLKQMAQQIRGIVFHGLVDRQELVRLLSSSKICANPHELSQTPGNVFAFKIIEYLAAGAHVLTTPMGALEKEVEEGITYIPDNRPATIAAALKKIIDHALWERRAAHCVHATYGAGAVARALDSLLHRVVDVKEAPSAPRLVGQV